MAKKIVIDPFSPSSVRSAVFELIRFQDWLKAKCDELCRVLAEDYALRTVADDYGYTEGGSIVCTVEEIPNGYRVVAAGEPVFFLEYGTGNLANTGEKLGTPPVPTTPGSYSMTEGKGKWQWWIDTTGSEDGFPWTIAPRSGMYYAFKAATENVRKVAEEVFRT